MLNTKHYLTPDVKYIEPIYDVAYVCRIHYASETFNSRIPSEAVVNQLLLHTYGTNIKARRDNLKVTHDIHRLGPILIDERYQFVMFPIEASKNKNPFLVNLYNLLQFSPSGENDKPTRIHFNDSTSINVAADYKFCEKQYERTLRVVDRSIKIKETQSLYLTRQVREK